MVQLTGGIIKSFNEPLAYNLVTFLRCGSENVIAKIECHLGELFPGVVFIVTNLPMEPDWQVRFQNQRGTTEQHIKEGKPAFRWTRLSCRRFHDDASRLQLHALAYNLANFLNLDNFLRASSCPTQWRTGR